MKIKILVLSLVVAALSTTSAEGTLAYLKDEKSIVATFTTGQVRIQIHTASIPRDIAATETDPAVHNTDEAIIADANAYLAGYYQEHCTAMLGNDECKKYTYVENIGQSDAYVRVRVLVPKSLISGEDPLITLLETASTEYNKHSSEVACESDPSEQCVEYIYTRAEKLSAGEFTQHPVIDAIRYNVIATAQAEEGANEIATSPTLDLTTSNIKVYAEAIQAQGFNNASEAFAHFTN